MAFDDPSWDCYTQAGNRNLLSEESRPFQAPEDQLDRGASSPPGSQAVLSGRGAGNDQIVGSKPVHSLDDALFRPAGPLQVQIAALARRNAVC